MSLTGRTADESAQRGSIPAPTQRAFKPEPVVAVATFSSTFISAFSSAFSAFSSASSADLSAVFGASLVTSLATAWSSAAQLDLGGGVDEHGVPGERPVTVSPRKMQSGSAHAALGSSRGLDRRRRSHLARLVDAERAAESRQHGKHVISTLFGD